MTGFGFSAVEKTILFAPRDGNFFWSNGYAWGRCILKRRGDHYQVRLSVLHGQLILKQFRLREFGSHRFDDLRPVKTGEELELMIPKD